MKRDRESALYFERLDLERDMKRERQRHDRREKELNEDREEALDRARVSERYAATLELRVGALEDLIADFFRGVRTEDELRRQVRT